MSERSRKAWSGGSLYVLSREAVREVDRLAHAEYGMSGLVLMENAARHAADVALEQVESVENPGAIVMCGPGNNGGDGAAVARHLHNAGLRVAVLLSAPAEKYQAEAAANLTIAVRMGLATYVIDAGDAERSLARAVAEATTGLGGVDVVVDALLGTGATRRPEEPIAAMVRGIASLREGGARVVSLDVPTGLDCQTGLPFGGAEEAVRADTTVTFVGLKPGFFALGSQEYLGDVVVADIGVPRELVERLGTAVEVRGQAESGRPRRSGRGGGRGTGRGRRPG